jgi:hypothetical protein
MARSSVPGRAGVTAESGAVARVLRGAGDRP